jgi:hypothetical protein
VESPKWYLAKHQVEPARPFVIDTPIGVGARVRVMLGWLAAVAISHGCRRSVFITAASDAFDNERARADAKARVAACEG